MKLFSRKYGDKGKDLIILHGLFGMSDNWNSLAKRLSKHFRVHLYLSNKYHRAAPKGIGNAKAIGNYSASLYPGSQAKSKGFNDMIYVHAKNEKIIEEMGAANLFILSDGELLTPKLGGSILDGVTRDSVIRIASDMLNLKVRETDIEIDRLLSADEVFL